MNDEVEAHVVVPKEAPNVSLGGVQSELSPSVVVDLPQTQEVRTDARSKPPKLIPEVTTICPMAAQTVHECTPETHRQPLPEAEQEESTHSGLEAAQKMMKVILKRVAKATAPKKLKQPRMKSGWMRLDYIISEFKIDELTFDDLLFREHLMVSRIDAENSYPVPVGGLTLDIQSARGGPLALHGEKRRSDYLCSKFLVHLASHLDFCGHNGGSNIIAWVDRDLQTLEEHRKEFVEINDEGELDQQSLYVNSQQNFYYLRANKKHDKYYSQTKAKNLICEGSSFVLMRYLAIKRFIGSFEVSTLYINGDLCRNVYKCKGPQSGMVYNKKMDVCKIYRNVIEQCGIQHKSVTLMTLSGRILKHEWLHCDYILQVNPLIDIGSKPSPSEHVPLEKAFESDLQLFSMYLDAKTANKKRIENYMNDHPGIRKCMADYVQTILHLKPENVFEFSAKYFLGFSPHLLPYTEYFEPPPVEENDDDLMWWKYF